MVMKQRYKTSGLRLQGAIVYLSTLTLVAFTVIPIFLKVGSGRGRTLPLQRACSGEDTAIKRSITSRELDSILAAHSSWLTENDAVLRSASRRWGVFERSPWEVTHDHPFRTTLRDPRVANLCNVDLTNVAGSALQHADLRYANLARTNLSQMGLDWADLRGADLSHANLAGTGLYETRLDDARLTEITATDAKFHGASLRRAYADNGQFRGAWFPEADLTEATLQGDVSNVYFRGTVLSRADLRLSPLGGAELDGAVDLANARIWNASEVADYLKGANQLTAARQVAASQRRALLERRPASEQLLESLVFGGWLTAYGGEPENVWTYFMGIILLFTGIYAQGVSRGEVFLNWKPRPGARKADQTFTRHLSRVRLRERSLLLLVVQYGLETAFFLQARPVDLARLASAFRELFRRNCWLSSTGRTRIMAGVHSLVSFYLLFVWIFNYFRG